MSGPSPAWGNASRFYLPNEDAAVLRAAVRLGRNQTRRPVFVGGSGLALLEAVGRLSRLESATFVDVADFQVEYFRMVLRALRAAGRPEDLRDWFADAVYPELRRHYLARGRDYSLPRVLAALRDLFGIEFFFDPKAFSRVRAITGHIDAVRSDIGSYLAGCAVRHDFIGLSNVPDYLDPAGLTALFAACHRHKAPVYLLLTSACPDRDAARRAWEAAGYAVHPASEGLNAANRGLGSPRLTAPWNRPGVISLLVAQTRRSARP